MPPRWSVIVLLATLSAACGADQLGRECVSSGDCASGVCSDGVCRSEPSDAGADTGEDAGEADAGPDDVGPDSGCATCGANEACFQGRCVLCSGATRIDGCECGAASECRSNLCLAGRCAACTLAAECSAAGASGLCMDGACFTCGEDGDACCPSEVAGEPSTCLEPLSGCTSTGVCGVCGALGQACCEGGCDEGSACSRDLCVACGNLGQPACAGAMPCVQFAEPVDGVCTRCGTNGSACCTMGAVPCLSGTCTAGLCQRDR